MAQFRKKPVVIEAMRVPPQCDDSNIQAHGELVVWLSLHSGGCDQRDWEVANGNGEIDIDTLEGTMLARNGDWIICGVKGELYPCKPDIFEATYESVWRPLRNVTET